MTALDASIRSVDSLIGKLRSGELLSDATSPVPPQAPPAQPASQPGTAAEAAAPAPAPPPAQKKAPPVAKAAKGRGGGGPVEGADLFAKVHFVVARVLSVAEHPVSDKLYITQLDVGSGAQRQVVAGLRKHVAAEALQGSLVAACLNLKAAKLAGEVSEGMILAASIPQGEGEKVEALQLPEGSQPGDPLYLEEAGPPTADGSAYAKQLKGDHWRKIAAGLAVGAGGARFEGKRVVTSCGAVIVPGMPDGAEIH